MYLLLDLHLAREQHCDKLQRPLTRRLPQRWFRHGSARGAGALLLDDGSKAERDGHHGLLSYGAAAEVSVRYTKR